MIVGFNQVTVHRIEIIDVRMRFDQHVFMNVLFLVDRYDETFLPLQCFTLKGVQEPIGDERYG